MGVFERFTSYKDGFGLDKDFNINDTLVSYYGGRKNVKEVYREINSVTKKKFKETIDINDQILQKYAKNNKDDVQAELMKKYLKLSQDDLNKDAIERERLEKELVEEEVDKSLDGVDKKTKEQVKKDLEQEQKEDKQKGKTPDVKDKKKELQSKIYEATYNRMYKDYASKVMNIKNAQYDDMAIAIGTKEAIEIIAMEKNLEKIDLLYHNHTNKNIDEVKKIKDNKKEFKSKFDYNQKGIENNTNDRARRINQLYAIREEQYIKYIKALKDPSKTPQEKALFKREYEEANLNLIQNIPSLKEYTQDLEIQGDNERLAKEAKVDEKSAVNNSFDDRGKKAEKVTQSEMADMVYDVQDTEKLRDKMDFEVASVHQQDALEKGNYSAAKGIVDAQRDKRIYDENIEQTPQQSVSNVQKDIEKEKDASDADFFKSLRKVNNIEDKTPEELKSIINDRNQDIEDKIKENAYKEKIEQEEQNELYRKRNKRPNG